MEHFDWAGSFIYPNINFLIFLALSIYFFRGPLATLAATRKNKFEEATRVALQAKEEADQKLAEINVRYAALDAEIKSIKDKAIADAEGEAKRIADSAKELAEHLRNETNQVAKAELQAAKAELRNQILAEVKLAVTGKIEKEFKEANQSAFIKKQINTLSSTTGA